MSQATRRYDQSRRRFLLGAGALAAGGALDLDGHFGLHPSLAFLHERYRAKEFLVLHAVASPYRDRSHFDGQTVLENGLTHAMGGADGWLNRALAAMPASNRRSGPRQGNDRALALSQNVPLILRGDQEVLSKSPQVTPEMDEDLMARLADLYSKDDWFSARLSEAVLEASGWDTHANQGGAQGTLANRLSGLDQSLRAFAGGLGPLWKRTVVMVVTEFGRTAAMNGTRGTDHGTGTCCFLVGGAIDGGRVKTQWPGLAPAKLHQGRDLSPTQDLRGVFKAVLSDHLTIDRGRLERTVFPDSGSVKPLLGLIKT